MTDNGLQRGSGRSPQEIRLKLWELLEKQVESYTAGDSSSLRTETAQELFQGVCYAVKKALVKIGQTADCLTEADARAIFETGLSLVRRETEITKLLWKKVCGRSPIGRSRALYETLESIGKGFSHYNILFFAHSFPCDIDYWLWKGIDEGGVGVDRVKRYLSLLDTENRIMSELDTSEATELYKRIDSEFADTPMNLCEPLCVNAVGRILAGGDLSSLSVTSEMRRRIAALPPEKISVGTAQAADRLCARQKDRDYFLSCASELTARIEKGKDLSNIFIEI